MMKPLLSRESRSTATGVKFEAIRRSQSRLVTSLVVSMKQFVSKVNGVLVLIAIFSASTLLGEDRIPEWGRALPRPEYKSLQRVPVGDSWFEVYDVAPGTYAIYEPHQSEETISYLIVGDQKALLFDTGMAIGNLRQTTAELTT